MSLVTRGCLLATVGMLALGGSAAADDALARALRAVMEENVRAYSAEDARGVEATIHSRSPEHATTVKALADQFRDQDVRARLVDFRLIGHDDEFAVARARIRFEGAAGSGFNDNVTDSLIVFKDEGGRWKLWTDEVLGVELSGRSGAGGASR